MPQQDPNNRSLEIARRLSNLLKINKKRLIPVVIIALQQLKDVVLKGMDYLFKIRGQQINLHARVKIQHQWQRNQFQ
jgi:hypothetical protein